MVRPVKDRGTLKLKDQEQQWEASQLCPEEEGDQSTAGSREPPAPAPLPWPPRGPGTSSTVFLQGSPTYFYPLPGPRVPIRAFTGMPFSLAEAWPVKRMGKGWAGAVGLNPCAHRGAGLPCHLLP